MLLNNAELSEQTRKFVLERKARAEAGKQQEPLERYEVAASRRDYDEALKLYRAIPDDNPYKQKHRESYGKVFELFAEQHVKLAEAARVDSQCEKFRSELQRVLDLEPAHVRAIAAKVQPCPEQPSDSSPVKQMGNVPRIVRPPQFKQVQAQQTKNSSAPVDALQMKQPTSASIRDDFDQPKAVKLSSAYVDQELHKAQNAFINSNYKESIAIAKAVQRGNPNRAWRIIGAAACYIKDVKLASESFQHLDSAGRHYMLYTCQLQGITSRDPLFKLSDE